MKESDFDVSKFFDSQRIGKMQIMVMLLCGLIMVADGYDVFVMGFLVPWVARAFHSSPAAVTPVFLFQGVGLAIGSYLVGPAADRIGRRKLVVGSALLFGLVTLATTQIKTLDQLMVARLLAGIFFASVMPNTVALTTEYAPSRLRATMITLMFIGYVAGVGSGGAVAALVVRRYGWQSAFWVGGLLPLVLTVLLWALLPESIRYCANRNEKDPRIPALLRKMDPSLKLNGNERFVLHEPPATGVALAALFRDGRAIRTLVVWVGYCMNMLVIYLMGAFLPTFLHTYGGMSLERAAGLTSFYSVAGIIAMIAYGWLIDHFGAAPVLAVTYFGAVISIVVLGLINLASMWIYLPIFGVGACVVGAQGGLHALTASIYPTRLRATGVSWAMGAGRIGAFFGPAIGGFVLHAHWAAFGAFTTAAVPMLITSLAMLLAGRAHTEGAEATAQAAHA